MKFHLISTLILAVVAASASADVYTAQYRGDLNSCGLDGGNSQTLATGGDFERLVAVSATDDYVYVGLVSSSAGNGIIRYNLDGTGETVISSNAVRYESLDVTDSNIYYISGMDIHVADLDGANDSVLYTLGTGLTAFWGDNMAATDSSLYWVVDDRRFQMCDLDGSNAAQIFQVGSGDGLNSAFCDGNYIYYSVTATNGIYRRDMDGTNETLLFSDATMAAGVTSLQVEAGTMYWAASNRSMYSMDLASSSVSEMYNFDTVFSSSLNRTIYADVVVPEPASMSMLALGGIFLIRRRNT